MKKLLFILLLMPFFCKAQLINPGIIFVPTTGGFIPTDSAGVVLWLKADDITGLSDGDPISTWTDASGNGNNATQSGANRPIYKTNQIDSKPSVRLDGSDDHFDLTTAISSAQPYTLFVVYKKRVTGVKFPTLTYSSNANVCTWMDWTDGNAYMLRNGATSYSAVANFTSFTLISQVSEASGESVWVNAGSVSVSTVSFSGVSNSFDRLGWRGAPDPADGDLVELIFVDHAMTTTGRTTFENYIHTKYPSLY